MENFSYVNIFETKGIEYLVIIAFLLLLVPFSMILNRKVRAAAKRKAAMGPALTASGLKVPQGLFFSGFHTWAFLEKSGIANIGLDDLLLHFTGEVKVQPLAEPGQVVRRGEPIAEIGEAEKKLKVCSPISGTLLKFNTELGPEPELLHEDPYGQGWVFRIKPADWKGEMASCHVAASATDWSRRELDRFRDFLAITMKKYNPTTSMVILQDGGEICDDALQQLPAEFWRDFQKDFLDPKEAVN